MNHGDQCRVLVVEDEFLVALQIEADLVAAGYSVIGPFTSLAQSISAARAHPFDIATLDLSAASSPIRSSTNSWSARCRCVC